MHAPDIEPRLIDTSVWIRADRKGHDALRDRLRELLIAGSVRICWPIRAELLIGVKTPERWAILNEQLAALEQVPILDQTWERAARLGHQLARKGQSVPLPDLLIAHRASAWPSAVERG
jgi:predicted nucleic acid-binding protein